MNAANIAFTHDFAADFDVLMRAIDGPPFAFARFADGEAALLRGCEHHAKSDGWRASGGAVPRLVEGLTLAIECELPGWHVGITAETHHEREHAELLGMVTLPESRVSFAELFIFGNYSRAVLLLSSIPQFRVVGAGARDAFGERGFDIPPDATADPKFDIEPALEWMLAGEGPLLLSAGPVAKWLAYEYWWSTHWSHDEYRRYHCIDVGSALSQTLRGRATRAYHKKSSDLRNWSPDWKNPTHGRRS